MYRAKTKKELGIFKHNVEPSVEFTLLAEEDERTGAMLKDASRYRPSMYFILQAMEKYVRAKIFSMVDARNEYFRREQRTHALQEAVQDLINIFSPDEHLRRQIMQQLHDYVLGDIKYEYLHNDLRYPKYSGRYNSYSSLQVSRQHCDLLFEKLRLLKVFLEGLDRLR